MRFDGFSIGSNDLTQLVLGADRDSGELANVFDEDNAAVKTAIKMAVEGAHRNGRPAGLCGQAPSDKPHFAAFLVELGVDSMSLTPDSVLKAIEVIAAAEKEIEEKELKDAISGVFDAETKVLVKDQKVSTAS
jgi:pyruvate,water dikinase